MHYEILKVQELLIVLRVHGYTTNINNELLEISFGLILQSALCELHI